MNASLTWPATPESSAIRTAPMRLVMAVTAMAGRRAPVRNKAAARGVKLSRLALDGESVRRFHDQILPHLDAAYNYAHVLTRGHAAAEDIVHDAYIRALTAFPGFRGGNSKAWILAIVRNCFFSWAKANGRRRADSPLDEIELKDESEDGEALVMRQQDANLIRRLVEQLPQPLAEVIVLREIEDLSYREIASAIEVPIGTVMSRLARARAALAQSWRAKTEGVVR